MRATFDTAKRAAKAYREAARLIERGEDLGCVGGSRCRFSCCALQRVVGDVDASFLVSPYRNLFLHLPREGWWDNSYPSEEYNDWRVLALCFMAAMAEAGDAWTYT